MSSSRSEWAEASPGISRRTWPPRWTTTFSTLDDPTLGFDPTGADFEFEYSTHNVMAGLRYTSDLDPTGLGACTGPEIARALDEARTFICEG